MSLLKHVRYARVRRSRPSERKRAFRKPRPAHRERAMIRRRQVCPDCGHRPDQSGLCRCVWDGLFFGA